MPGTGRRGKPCNNVDASGRAEATDRYLELVRSCPLRPIRNEAELDRAIAMIDSLIDRGLSTLTPDEDDYLDVLSDLVERYEDVHHPMPSDRAEV